MELSLSMTEFWGVAVNLNPFLFWKSDKCVNEYVGLVSSCARGEA